MNAAPAGEVSGRRFMIEDIYPMVDAGRYPVKRIAGEPVDVWCDLFRDGHDVVTASLLWRMAGEREWRREGLRHHENDRWHGSFTPPNPGEPWRSRHRIPSAGFCSPSRSSRMSIWPPVTTQP